MATWLPIPPRRAPVNVLLHSMFSQEDVSLNGTLISSSTNTYPYRSMLETLLSYGEGGCKEIATVCRIILQRRRRKYGGDDRLSLIHI